MTQVTDTTLWRETAAIPGALRRTVDEAEGFAAVAQQVSDTPGRLVTVGNGAAYYVGLALWLASLQSSTGPTVVALPAGVAGSFAWRDDDLLLAVSSSGRLRDVIALQQDRPGLSSVALTANPGSPVAMGAKAAAVVYVAGQDALTHTQAFAGNLVAALSVWAEVTGDEPLSSAVRAAPEACEASLALALPWAAGLAGRITGRRTALCFGSGPAWAASMEAALLLKEIALLPAEGMETREGATSGMYPLGPHDLVLSLATGADALLEEAEQTCRRTGALVERVPGGELADPRLAALTTFAPVLALAASLGLSAGLDVDAPSWADAYYATARTA